MIVREDKFPLLYAFSWLLTAIGAGVCTIALILQPEYKLLKGSLQIGAGILLFGVGELLNHPRDKTLHGDKEDFHVEKEYTRKRNACALGNLLDIVGLLIFFVGLSAFL